MGEDDFLEAAYEERYEGEDYNLYEEQQVFLDNEGGDDEDDEPCECAYQLPCAEHPEETATDIVSVADPNPLGVDVDAAAESIYGGEGHGSVNARQLVCIQPLADRSALSHKERIIILDADVRDAMAYARARLDAEAMKYSAQGFTWNLDDIHYEHGGRRIVTATLRIARDGA